MNPPIITKRLSRDTNYKPTGSTYTQQLSEAEIKKKLEDYTRVKKEEVPSIPLNTHIRYFSINPKTGEKQFRMGGMLTKHDPNNQYIVCSNGTLSWSVQIANSIFYKKMTNNEYKEHIQTEVQDSVQDQLEVLIKENKELKKVLKQIKDTTINNGKHESGKHESGKHESGKHESGKHEEKTTKREDKSGKYEDKSGKYEDKSGKYEDKSGKYEDKSGKHEKKGSKKGSKKVKKIKNEN
jgi:hypothetical protein